ncbi:Uncharacterized protein At5g39865 [Linum perenne]
MKTSSLTTETFIHKQLNFITTLKQPPPSYHLKKPISDFPLSCPPAGSDSIILYTTSLRSIRKTFEECHSIRFLLQSFRVTFHERDVSMDLGFRDELWKVLGDGERVIPPRLFVKGRYIGGADEVISLHEQGKLRKLLEGIPVVGNWSSVCSGCGNLRFVVCCCCNGSRKVVAAGGGGGGIGFVRCLECNENGLMKCSVCS